MKTLILILTVTLLGSVAFSQSIEQASSQTLNNRNNAIYVAQDMFLNFTLNYERLFPFASKTRLGFRTAIGRDGGNKDNTALVGCVLVYGNSKHKFEAGVNYLQPNFFDELKDDNPKMSIYAGYRYQTPSGFLFKIYPEFLPDFWPTEDSWGSLPFLGFALGYAF